MKAARFRVGAFAVLAFVVILAGAGTTHATPSPNLVISQVYGGGGNTGATFTNDYIEIFNRGTSAVSLNGLSLQYASATGTGNFGITNQLTVLPSVSLNAGQYFLVQEAGGATGAPLPTPDLSPAAPINLSGTGGKVALVNGTTSLGCNGGSTPCSPSQLAQIVDLIGYDGANFFEGAAAAPGLSATTAALRADGGCTDTDNNSADFTAGVPGPRSTGSPANDCAATSDPSGTVGFAPLNPTPGADATISVVVTPGAHPTSTGLAVNCNLSWAGVGASVTLFDDGTNGDPTAGDLTFSRLFTVSAGTTPGTKVGTCTITDDQSRSAAAPYSVDVVPGVTDLAPTITSHTPASDETGVAIGANIGITFSEAVDLADGWYSISCGTSGPHTAAVIGSAASYLLDPDADFVPGETCTVTIDGTKVTDHDTDDPPDNLVGSPSWSFSTAGLPQVAVSQVYGGGGNANAPYRNDFIELYNHGSTDVSLNGWSVQYASAAGTSWQVTNLGTFTLQPGQHYLVQEASNAAVGAPLPAADVSGSINMSATSGKVALVNSTTALTSCTSTAIVDLVGYGTANCAEGTATAALTNTTAAIRKGAGATDTDNNSADFDIGPPTPRNSGTVDNAPAVFTTSPDSNATNVPIDSNVTINFTEPVNVADGWYTISCTTTGSHTAAVSGGPTSFSLDTDTDFANGESCTVTVVAADVTDQDTIDPPDTMAGDVAWNFATASGPPVAIHDIQGAAHISPKNGQIVSGVRGIVTAVSGNGYWMQDANPDSDPSTSEGIFVFTSSRPTVAVGDLVSVSGRVQEFRPGGTSTGNLTTTELSGSPTITVVSSGNALPAPTVVGDGGRIPPNQVIEDDASGNVETTGTFDPGQDGLDFWESLEGMRVQVNDAVAVGPTNSFGETPIVGDNGAHAGPRTARGGVLLRPDDANPERVVADDLLVPMPSLNVGDGYTGPIVGVMDYNFGNPFIEVTNAVGRVDNHLQREVTDAPGPVQLSVSTFNFENLDPSDPPAKFAQLAQELVTNLKSPDIVAGEEVQDSSGPTDDGVVDASQTLTQLVNAVQAAGGPKYEWREIDPVNDQDGGEPGGNIRQVFLFRTDRGVSFVDRPGGTSTAATGVTGAGATTQLTFSPGRIAPDNAAWSSSRKPLAGEFTFHGSHLFVIANHFNSKGGDNPLMGRFQPPTRSSETQRHQQAQLVADFVSQLTTADPNANVIVLGDLNDFEFSETVGILEAAGLHDLMNTLPLNQRYSYEFEGNAQVLDHILFSGSLFGQPFAFDPVHVNAEFADQASDHDPSVVRLRIVTFTSLCDLAKEVVTDPSVASGLCDKLIAAAAAAARGNTASKDNQLKAFRSQVDAQIGKSISGADAELLKSLSMRL